MNDAIAAARSEETMAMMVMFREERTQRALPH